MVYQSVPVYYKWSSENSPGLVSLEAVRERLQKLVLLELKQGKKLAVIDSQYRSEKGIIKIDSVKIEREEKRCYEDFFTVKKNILHYNIVNNYLFTVNNIKSNYIKS